MKYTDIREQEIKNKVTEDYFWLYDCTKVIGNVDFCVSIPKSKGINPLVETQSLLWAEAKKESSDIYKSFIQLILTIGKARTFDKFLPPAFLGAFDGEKVAFIPYNEVQDIFYLNDFNWNVAPSNHETKEFKLIYERIVGTLRATSLQFNYLKDDFELKRFIKTNFADTKFGLTKIKIDKNNFLNIYNKWLDVVKPTIQIDDWQEEKKNGILDADFYLADLISAENKTLKDKLSILLNTDLYEINFEIPNYNKKLFSRIGFSDNQKAHTQFWAKYERPPLEDYWDYIVDHRHLLVPQDIRERKGSFYTPRIWVELSQKYLAEVLGEDWQDEYYVWDCCAGTGNLLAGLTNKYNIWASTLDKADVDVMKDRIENGANLLESHVFQFDFLNDDFSKLPQGLQDIINDERKRKKLVIYINPPYVEGDSKIGKGRSGTQESKIRDKYKNELGKASSELFAQFFMRIYCEIPSCRLAQFSKLKHIQAPNFENFRNVFIAKLEKLFLIPADTFDNVTGKFPIGFFVWDTSKKDKFHELLTDVYNKNGGFIEQRNIVNYDGKRYISDWLKEYSKKISKNYIGHLASVGNDFQHYRDVYIDDVNRPKIAGGRHTMITEENLIIACIYFAARKVIPATWLNDRDQFLYPNDGWKTDFEFQNDCLAYTLFHSSNNISSKYGTNHWIPFNEYRVGARDKFRSQFMYDFINGEEQEPMVCEPMLFFADNELGGGGGVGVSLAPVPREFSETARFVFKAGGDLWKHYHSQKFQGNYNVNASLYDIRQHFQGRNEKGIMNAKSKDDGKYNELNENLRLALKLLAKKIEPKIYEHGFLIN